MKGFTLVMAAAAACLWLSPVVGRAEHDGRQGGERQDRDDRASGTHTLTCGPEKTIGQAIKGLKPGDTLLVSGTCNENLDVGEEVHRITLDGQGSASINGDSSASAVSVTGTGITIRGFVITGGAPQGIAVTDGGAAVIDGNTIQVRGQERDRRVSKQLGRHRQQHDPEQSPGRNRDPVELERSHRVDGSSQQPGERAEHDSEQWSAGGSGVQRVVRTDLLEHHPEQRQPRRLRGPKRAG